jgi:hypothetical protein
MLEYEKTKLSEQHGLLVTMRNKDNSKKSRIVSSCMRFQSTVQSLLRTLKEHRQTRHSQVKHILPRIIALDTIEGVMCRVRFHDEVESPKISEVMYYGLLLMMLIFVFVWEFKVDVEAEDLNQKKLLKRDLCCYQK